MAAVVSADGYQGPPELTVARAFTSWTLDVPVLAVVLLAGVLYLAGVRRMRRTGGGWGAGRTAAFCGGLGVIVIATMSFLGVYQWVLFYARAIQTVLLLLAAPLLLALGRPLSLALAATPRLGRRVEALVASRPARVLTFPAITALAVVLVGFLLYFTPWYEAGLRNDLVRELTYLALLAPGAVFFWTLLRVDPVPKAYPYLVTMWVTGTEVVGDAILGLAIMADQNLIAESYYRALGRPWGPSLRADQVVGGGAIWLIGDLIGLPFLGAMLIQMMREDEKEARAVDAELDAAEAQPGAAEALPRPVEAGLGAADPGRGTADPGQAAAGTGQAAAGTGQPWWERDPRFAGRFRPPGSG
jgi:cytochrome c oxidase assembly factor CtaG